MRVPSSADVKSIDVCVGNEDFDVPEDVKCSYSNTNDHAVIGLICIKDPNSASEILERFAKKYWEVREKGQSSDEKYSYIRYFPGFENVLTHAFVDFFSNMK